MQEWLNHIKRQCLTYQSGSFWQHGIKRFSVLPKLRSAVLERILFWFNIPLFYFANQNLMNNSVILFMEWCILENRILTIALIFCLKAPFLKKATFFQQNLPQITSTIWFLDLQDFSFWQIWRFIIIVIYLKQKIK